MTMTVVVPTKDRPALLQAMVRAVLEQSRVPDELLVVDQSASSQRAAVRALIDAAPAGRRPALRYIWDRGISGAAEARNVGMDLAAGDIIVFWDDDVVPEPGALAALREHYARHPTLGGIAPLIVNYSRPGFLRRLQHHVFNRGPFRDERQPIYWQGPALPPGTLIPVRMFTGAMMSFRRVALGDVRHDARYRRASTGEDVDLCWSLGRRGVQLAIATDIRIRHEKAPRPPRRAEEAMLTSWAFLFDKHVDKTWAARLAFAWFVVGVLIGAVVAAVRERSAEPLRSAAAGLRGIWTGYAGSAFLAPSSPPREHRRQAA